MARAPQCPICGRFFRPDVRSVRHQRYDRRSCYRKAKRERDREHKRAYRGTGLGAEQRKRENRRLRDRLGWAEYMHYWRKANPARSTRVDRKAARRYYERHRQEILARRRLKRTARKALETARSQ